jgi:hypothetical protein
VLRMLVRGARPARAIVAGQGLDAINHATSRSGRYRRVLSALPSGRPSSPDHRRRKPHTGSPNSAATRWHSVTSWTRSSRHPAPH